MASYTGITTLHVNVRRERPSVNAPTFRTLKPNQEVEISHAITGEMYLDSNIWYVLTNQTFVWSPAVSTTSEVPLIEKKLLITADDIGVVDEIDIGAQIALREGWINSLAVLVNRPEDVESTYLKDFCRKLRDYQTPSGRSLFDTTHIGLHFTITSGEPISSHTTVRRLVDENNKFLDFRKFNKDFEKPDYVTQIKTEFFAQYEKFKEIFGREPDHLTSHHDVLTFNRPLFEFMQDWARTKGIPLRNHRYLPGSKRFWYDTLALMQVNLPSTNRMNEWEGRLGPFPIDCSQRTVVDHYGPIPPFGITCYDSIVSKKQRALDSWMKDFLVSTDSRREIVIHLMKSAFRSQPDFVSHYGSLRSTYPGIEIKYFDGRVAEYLSLQKNCHWKTDPCLGLLPRL
ncbi:hypothetical protein GCM10009119_10760 [Algoriphagus jejuensis]|uniref:YdjC-like protein n=1 Tax=Algoriphagus jejuensis TaxID=419934 RepID=A0ABN1MXZ0_9BACT